MTNEYVDVGGDHEEAISVFVEMAREGVRPSSRTVVALLLACGEVMELRLGQEIQRNGLFHDNHHVGTALIGFYVKFNLKVSHDVFDMMEVKNMVSWTAMIAGYFEAGDYLMVLELHVRILEDGGELDEVVVLIVIQACSEHGSLGLARQIHQMAIKSDVSRDVYTANAFRICIVSYRNQSLLLKYLNLFLPVMWNRCCHCTLISAVLKKLRGCS